MPPVMHCLKPQVSAKRSAAYAQSGKDRLLSGPPHTTRHADPHRAVHEQGAHDFSSVSMSFHPEITDTHQPLPPQPIIAHPDLRCLGPRQMPVAFTADSRNNRHILVDALRQKMADLRAGLAPLFPVTQAYTSA